MHGALSNSYTASTGLTFQWYHSAAASGPFTAVGAATSTSMVTPSLNAAAYYYAVVTCTGSGQSYTTPVLPVTVTNCTACTGAPASNPIVPVNPTVCAGNSSTLSLSKSYSLSGYSFQWQVSGISPVGPFTPIAGVTGLTHVTPSLNNTTYFGPAEKRANI